MLTICHNRFVPHKSRNIIFGMVHSQATLCSILCRHGISIQRLTAHHLIHNFIIVHNIINVTQDFFCRIRLFFYYPDDEYLRLLLTGDSTGLTDEIYFLDEIDCSDLFDTDDPRERVMIFELI